VGSVAKDQSGRTLVSALRHVAVSPGELQTEQVLEEFGPSAAGSQAKRCRAVSVQTSANYMKESHLAKSDYRNRLLFGKRDSEGDALGATLLVNNATAP
jgi:hypothetical protein